jgi:hypothetical protein
MKLTCLLAIAMFLALAGHSAEARPRPHGIHGKKFQANKRFGLGLELGEPTGVTGKYFLQDGGDRALDFGVGGIYDYYGYRGIHLYLDYLFHPASLASTDAFELPFYIGIGGRFWSWEDRRIHDQYYNGDAIGVRVPIGLSFDFNNVPLDIFVQLVPTADVFFAAPSTYDRHFYLIIDGSVGIRYYFN